MFSNVIQKILYLIFGIFTAIGLVMIVAGICIRVNTGNFAEDAMEITGTISSIERYRDIDGDIHHYVYVNFTYNGKEYRNVELSEYSSSMYEGKKITLLFNPEADGTAIIRTKSMINLPAMIVFFIGIIFLIIGLAGIIPTYIIGKKVGRKKNLVNSGRRIEATVKSIEKQYNVRINGRHPFIIICTYTDIFTGIQYCFKSSRILKNPEPAVRIGDTIDVYVDEKDYSKYYVAAEENIDLFMKVK